MPVEPQPKVILCTTENTLEKISAAMAAGADEYIMKPFDKEILQGKLIQLGLEQIAEEAA
jgi:two-component system chemotaxis response regulator CheY